MKIGILTYHRTLNYGACLQAVAMRVVLEKMGHDVFYVDYWPPYHAKKYSIFSWHSFRERGIKGKIEYVLEILKNHKYIKERIANFEAFHRIYTYPYCKPITERFDVIIYGSDQIWRKQKELKSYNPIYFASKKECAKRHIAYSASIGKLPTDLSDIIRIKELIANFDRISVREKDLCSFLFDLGYEDVIQTVDPTLLLNIDVWKQMLPKRPINNKRYILVYALWDNVFDMRMLNRFAMNKGCEIRFIRGNVKGKNTYDNILTADPIEFLNLINNAEFVFSSSFHGTVFSILFEKQFYASIQVNPSRVISLLEITGLSNRFLQPLSIIPDNSDLIDFSVVKNQLRSTIEFSKNYLFQAIDK